LLGVLDLDVWRALDDRGRDGDEDAEEHDVHVERTGDLEDERDDALGHDRAVEWDDRALIHGSAPVRAPRRAGPRPAHCRRGRRGWASGCRAGPIPRRYRG